MMRVFRFKKGEDMKEHVDIKRTIPQYIWTIVTNPLTWKTERRYARDDFRITILIERGFNRR